ncbi:DUF2268 domain-containing putative Zn-dependent protease [Hymenobacter koreensis]|uniref:DUF2268 domain-containing protein n=1 Tax=Hymenobacter koreensis TaxID=1084523 RepID=A0ABP8IV81_9BACT
MRFVCLLWVLLWGLNGPARAQTPALPANPTDPHKAKFFTYDVANFWRAYDAWRAGQPGNPFAELYVKLASPGAKILLEKSDLAHPDSLLRVVQRRSADYERVRAASLRMGAAIPECRKSYAALKKLYPAATFPPVYFAIGGFLVGGNAVPAAQIIGAEMNEPANIPPLVAHELIHVQQHIPYTYKILLEQCIIEGSADFLAELISGKPAGGAAYDYARGREKQLWQEFERDQNLGENDSFALWLYGGERPAGRPADLGYVIGYQITKAYYDGASDKRQAVYDILHIQDCREFLRRSGYAARFK